MVKYIKSSWDDFKNWDWFICGDCGEIFKSKITQDSYGDFIMPNCPHCATHRYKDCDNSIDGYANKDVHFFDPQNNEELYVDYNSGNVVLRYNFGDTAGHYRFPDDK